MRSKSPELMNQICKYVEKYYLQNGHSPSTEMSNRGMIEYDGHEIQTTVEAYEKRVYTVDEIIDILGIGKNAAYTLVNSGVFHSVKIGGHYRISKKSFDQWLDDSLNDDSNCQGCE